MRLSKHILCPFCFNHFELNNVKFRCANSRCKGMVEDSAYQEYQGLTSSSLMGPVFSATSKGFGGAFNVPTSAKCPDCDRETTKRVCPVCHYELHHDVGTTDEKIIAIVGGRATGKSSYIATLVQRLRNEVGSNFNAGIISRGDMTRQRYEEDFYHPLYKQLTILQATQAGAKDRRTKTPMVYRISFNQAKNQAVTLVLFDTAGEDMRSLDTMSTEARYITNSQGLVFLLDPLQIPAVREQMPSELLRELSPDEDPEAEPIKIIERLYELFEKDPRWRGKQKIETPVAFTLAKIDVLFPILDPGSALHRSGDHLGYLNKADVETVHSEIAAYLHEWMGTEFDQLVKSHFKDYHYFGMSALGKAPVNGKLDGISPIRVEDPLLWIFSRFKVIKEK